MNKEQHDNTTKAIVERLRETFSSLVLEINKHMVGQEEAVERALIALFTGGHVLIEGVPGLGKTQLVKTLADAVNAEYSRIQFTPDLMPAELLGTHVFANKADGAKNIEFKKGPIFGNIILADEINRATPKTQSALLEAMQEGTVTTANQSFVLEQPFTVFATQNPLEMEGTYPLPEAQLDRFFFKLVFESPSRKELHEILEKTTLSKTAKTTAVINKEQLLLFRELILKTPVTEPVMDYAIRLLQATHPGKEFSTQMVSQYVRHGASPRGAQSMIIAAKAMALLDGRFAVAIDDIKAVSLSSLRHRLQINFEGNADGINSQKIIEDIVKRLPEVH